MTARADFRRAVVLAYPGAKKMHPAARRAFMRGAFAGAAGTPAHRNPYTGRSSYRPRSIPNWPEMAGAWAVGWDIGARRARLPQLKLDGSESWGKPRT